MAYTNSSLVSYTKISPNRTVNRNHIIDRVTIHCVVGQCSVETLGSIFAPSSRQASCNYGIGSDGRIALICEEKDRSWCTSSGANDHRAVTIEVASDTTHPYAVNDKAYQATIDLVADICKRNGKKRITWLADKEKSINYAPTSDEMLMTVHRWFANKACPGDYLYNRHSDIAARVNAILAGTAAPTTTVAPAPKPAATPGKVTATKAAQEKDASLSGTYKVTATDGLHLRNGAGTNFASLCLIPFGTAVKNYGYYTTSKNEKWLYIQFTLNGITYTGFSHRGWLKKA
ncbi:MAG: N-acetylmuramoyl-L-alanine amidase [Ruminococcus flavefaciens]|nr:N-acetylmuramoyl-L-alanine amidase [Ruminococcus flavefaciens]